MRFDKYEDCENAELEDQYAPVSASEPTDIVQSTQVPSAEQPGEAPSNRGQIGQFKIFRIILLIWTLYGASCVMADGLLTPAVSVVSAVNGSSPCLCANDRSRCSNSCSSACHHPLVAGNNRHPGTVHHSHNMLQVVNTNSCALQFMIQSTGTKRISNIYAPIVFIWFLVLLTTGLINIVNTPTILQSFNPIHVIHFLFDSSSPGLSSLSGILLSITGVEALFADLAHYNRHAIQYTFTCFVYPALVVAYLGQGACLISHPEWFTNTFWNCIFGGWSMVSAEVEMVQGNETVEEVVYWFVLVIATLTTVIASQAMILGTFTIVSPLHWFSKLLMMVDSSGDSSALFSCTERNSYGSRCSWTCLHSSGQLVRSPPSLYRVDCVGRYWDALS
jgi:KUP system potassium uptake protein